MNTVIVPVESVGELELVESIASEVWNEHYASILSKKQIDYMLNKFQSVAAMQRQIIEQGYKYFLLYTSVPLGYFAIKVEESTLFLSKFYILNGFRGAGHASAGFKFIEKMASDLALPLIWLTVNKENADSIAIYRHKGYDIVREQVADIGDGFVMDDYIMEKHIDL